MVYGLDEGARVTRQDVLNWLATTPEGYYDYDYGEYHVLRDICPLGVNLGEYDITVDNFNWADYGMSDTPDARDTTVMPTESATTVMPTESATTVMPTESATTVMPTATSTTAMPTREQCLQHYESALGSLYRVDHENPEHSFTPEQFYRWSTGTRDGVTVTRQDVLNWLATTRNGRLIVDGEHHILGEYCPLGVNLGEYDITVDNFNWADYGMSDTPDARDLMFTTTVMPTESATTAIPTVTSTTRMIIETPITGMPIEITTTQAMPTATSTTAAMLEESATTQAMPTAIVPSISTEGADRNNAKNAALVTSVVVVVASIAVVGLIVLLLIGLGALICKFQKKREDSIPETGIVVFDQQLQEGRYLGYENTAAVNGDLSDLPPVVENAITYNSSQVNGYYSETTL